MTWVWVICFSTVLVAADVSGRVELRDSKEKSVAREHVYSGVSVWLERVNAKAPAAAPGRAVMVQKNKRFIPHVLTVRAGTVVDFPNQDPIFHNAFSNYSGQIFDIGLYKPGSSRAVPFTRPGVVRVFCNIHSNMSAVIVVVDTPWFATTTAKGEYLIEGVPPGEYKVRLFHERATPEELARHERTVRVPETGLAMNPIQISETGYLPAPHLDKHGKPYDHSSDSYKVMK